MSDQEYLHKKLDRIITDQACIIKELENVKRGIYGDEVNGTPGLIRQQKEEQEQDSQKFKALNKRVDSIERKQYKIFVWGGSIVTALQLLWNYIKS